MALQISLATDSGLDAPNAYLRVGDLVHGKSNGQYCIWFCIAFYADAQAASEGREAINPPRPFPAVPYDLNGANPYVQAYDYVKANAYPEAVDA